MPSETHNKTELPGADRRQEVTLVTDQPINIGSDRQLFVDHYLIDSADGVELELHRPRSAGNVLTTDAPWEGSTCDYHTVIKDGDTYRMYYRGTSHDGYEIESLMKPGEAKIPVHVDLTSYAESRDGITWTRPSLGIVEYEGSKDNSIVWIEPGTDMVPFLDGNPEAKPDERYKAIVRERVNDKEALMALASGDGVHWRKMQEAPILDDPPFDTQNVPFWDPWRAAYVIYTRGKHGEGRFTHGRASEGAARKSVRWIRRATSSDFLNWSALEPIDTGDAPIEHMYTNGTMPYLRAPGVYLAFPRRFMPEQTRHEDANWPGVADSLFMSSRDGINWDRTFLESYIRPGPDPRNWMSRATLVSNGIVQTGDEELSMYILRNRDFPTCHFERMVLRLDGFVSAGAGYGGGELTTPPLVFDGDELELNYSTSAAGHVSVEVQDADGAALAGLGLADCKEMLGDEIEGVVRWGEGATLGSLSGKPVRLRFAMKDADLYAFRFRRTRS